MLPSTAATLLRPLTEQVSELQIAYAEGISMPFHLPVPGRKNQPAPGSSAQLELWTAWHTATLIIALADLGVASLLLILHFSVSIILALIGGAEAIGLGLLGGLYQLTQKKPS
jgi:hypothetical protein